MTCRRCGFEGPADPCEACTNVVRQRVRVRIATHLERPGLERASRILRDRADQRRLPCCRCALLEAAAVLDVLGLEPTAHERGG